MEVLEEPGMHAIKDEGKVRNMAVRSLRLDFPTGVKMINAKLPELRALSREELFKQHNMKTKDEDDKTKVSCFLIWARVLTCVPRLTC